MKAQNAALNVLLSGQAYLWADMQRFRAEARGETVSDERFRDWMHEWRAEAEQEITTIVKGIEDAE